MCKCSGGTALVSFKFMLLLTYRLILIAEKSTVYEKFPTPLINRLEKHFVLTKTVLQEEWQQKVHQRLNDWVEEFCNISQTSRK